MHFSGTRSPGRIATHRFFSSLEKTGVALHFRDMHHGGRFLRKSCARALFQGTIVIRTSDKHKNLHIPQFCEP